MASPLPWWYGWGNKKVDDSGDQSKKSTTVTGPIAALGVTGLGGKRNATRDLIASGLSETHPADVIEAVTIAVREYAENGELPEVIQISDRSRSELGEWQMKLSTFKLIAMDRQLKKSAEFELVSSDSMKRGYKFTFRPELQQLIPTIKEKQQE
jgi:hypothetical protein